MNTWMSPILLVPLVMGGCDSTEPLPPPSSTVELTVEDVGVTDVWLKVGFTDSNGPRSLALNRDGKIVSTITLVGIDSILLDEGLLPSHTYSYQAFRLMDSTSIAFSEKVQVTTMDTTSHDIIWTIETLGDGAGSILNDVVIINDTLAYAVGEISVLDSSGQFQIPPYNVAKWNGHQWQLSTLKYNCRLFFPNCGPDTLLFGPGSSVYAFGPNDIWIAAGSVHHFDGKGWTQYASLEAGSAHKIWGNVPDNLWFVGNGGVLVHYDGQTWLPTGIGTNLPIWDIWGGTDLSTGEQVILCIASDIFQGSGRRVSSIEGSRVTALSDSGLSYRLTGVWFKPDRYYYIVGDGVHWKRGLSTTSWNSYPPGVVTSYFSGGIRGTDINDIFVVGSFMEIVHFNGLTWKNFFSQIPPSSGALGHVAVSEHLVIAVGLLGQKAVALVGTR